MDRKAHRQSGPKGRRSPSASKNTRDIPKWHYCAHCRCIPLLRYPQQIQDYPHCNSNYAHHYRICCAQFERVSIYLCFMHDPAPTTTLITLTNLVFCFPPHCREIRIGRQRTRPHDTRWARLTPRWLISRSCGWVYAGVETPASLRKTPLRG
jgi:hypothetical protein